MNYVEPGSITQAAELIARSDGLIVAAGAGMGVDSGLPDFRGKEGFWKAYPTLGREQVDFYRIACPEAFRTQPSRAWGFCGHRLTLYRKTEPHAILQNSPPLSISSDESLKTCTLVESDVFRQWAWHVYADAQSSFESPREDRFNGHKEPMVNRSVSNFQHDDSKLWYRDAY